MAYTVWFPESAWHTRDAILLARRAIDQASELKDGKVILLALYWAKAFDSVSPTGLIGSLRRFGIRAPFRDMISPIDTDRRFLVKDAGDLFMVQSIIRNMPRVSSVTVPIHYLDVGFDAWCQDIRSFQR